MKETWVSIRANVRKDGQDIHQRPSVSFFVVLYLQRYLKYFFFFSFFSSLRHQKHLSLILAFKSLSLFKDTTAFISLRKRKRFFISYRFVPLSSMSTYLLFSYITPSSFTILQRPDLWLLLRTACCQERRVVWMFWCFMGIIIYLSASEFYK